MSDRNLKEVFAGIAGDVMSFPRRYIEHVYETKKADYCNENHNNPDFDPEFHNFAYEKFSTVEHGLHYAYIAAFTGVVTQVATGDPILSMAFGLAAGGFVVPAIVTKYQQFVMDSLIEDNEDYEDGLENLPDPLKIFPSLGKSEAFKP